MQSLDQDIAKSIYLVYLRRFRSKFEQYLQKLFTKNLLTAR